MINPSLFHPDVQKFIRQNLHSDPAKIVLKGSPFEKVEAKLLARQIQARQKIRSKLPTWFKADRVIYPPLANLSQSSSEITARYKADLISGDTLIDITGGFGVDDFYFSDSVKQIVHCEQNNHLSEIAEHNLKTLTKSKKFSFFQGDGLQYLKSMGETVDWTYADPGRISASGKKIFRLEDSQPNILSHLSLLLEKSTKILLKTSPLLDIKQGIRQLKSIREIHVIAVKNEVKELLWIIGKKPPSDIPIKTVNFNGKFEEKFQASLRDENETEPKYSAPLRYLYEPNRAILKAGFFKSIARECNIFKLATNSHLYTAQIPLKFPGRRFKILTILKPHKTEIKKLQLRRANIAVRNFPAPVSQIRKRLNLKDGGKDYLFFTQTQDGKKLAVHCQKF